MHVLREVLGNEYPVSGSLSTRPGPKPKFTDIEVIALSLTAECLGIDSELYLFNKLECDYKNAFPELISRRQYNDRRKMLFYHTEGIRRTIVRRLNAINNVYIVDSMPLEICKLSRMERNKMGKEDPAIAPDKGYCASQGKYYYGYKIHAVCSPNGVLQAFDLSQASRHDVKYLKDLIGQISDCTLIGDRGYISNSLKNELMEKSGIDLQVPMRSNQKEFKPAAYPLKRLRKRIETVFSQLCDQFNIQRNYAKSFAGFRTRILAKITGFSLLQFVNMLKGKLLGRVKYALK